MRGLGKGKHAPCCSRLILWGIIALSLCLSPLLSLALIAFSLQVVIGGMMVLVVVLSILLIDAWFHSGTLLPEEEP